MSNREEKPKHRASMLVATLEKELAEGPHLTNQLEQSAKEMITILSLLVGDDVSTETYYEILRNHFTVHPGLALEAVAKASLARIFGGITEQGNLEDMYQERKAKFSSAGAANKSNKKTRLERKPKQILQECMLKYYVKMSDRDAEGIAKAVDLGSSLVKASWKNSPTYGSYPTPEPDECRGVLAAASLVLKDHEKDNTKDATFNGEYFNKQDD